MKLCLQSLLFLAAVACLHAAGARLDPLESSESESNGNSNRKCRRFIVFTTMPTGNLGGIKLRGAFVALLQPRPRLFIHSSQATSPFDAIFQGKLLTSTETVSGLVSSTKPNVEESRPSLTFDSESHPSDSLDSASNVEGVESDPESTLEEGENKVALSSGSAASEGFPGGLQDRVLDESAHFSEESETGEESLVLRPFFLRKMLIPIERHVSPFQSKFAELNRRGFIRMMQLGTMKEGNSREELDGDGIDSANGMPHEVIQKHEDGSMSYHKSVDFPHGHFSVDVFSSKPFIPVSEASDPFEGEENPTLVQTVLGALDSFYNSIFGSLFIGVGCGLILSMITFFILSVFFPEGNEDETTAFILSTSQSPSTPLLDDAIGSDSESVSSEGGNSKYQPPQVEN